MRRPGLLLLTLAFLVGCGELGEPTQAELHAPAGDVTSCRATRSTTGCGPSIACTGTIAECASVGCWVVGTNLYLYGDGSWRDPEPEPGTWHFGPVEVAENGAAYDFACPPEAVR